MAEGVITFDDASMAQLNANDVSYDYEGTPVLRSVNMSLGPGTVLGLVGDNGAGKSTLLWLLSGRRKPTSGSVTHIGARAIGSQELEAPFGSTGESLVSEALGPSRRRLQAMEDAATAMAEHPEDPAVEQAYSDAFSDVTAHDDWSAEHNASVVLDYLGLNVEGPDGPLMEQLTAEMSGGQRAMLGLALTLIRKPEILLLDEPTNHLDEQARQMLVSNIAEHPGIVVVATHDRDFLDAVCTHIGDLVLGRPGIGMFRGNWTEYDKHRRREREIWEHQWRTEQHERDRLEKTIDSMNRVAGPISRKTDNEKMGYSHSAGRADRTVARRIRAARSKLDELDEFGVEKPPAVLGLDAPLTTAPSNHRIAAGSDEDFHIKLRSVVVPDRLRVGSLTVRPGETVVVTGPNGAGKSTLLRVIAQDLEPQAGEVRIGQEARLAVLRQEQEWDDPRRTPEELFSLASPTGSKLTLDDLALITPEDAQRPVGDLSVGQQRRVALALIAAAPPQILLLDEPTNHLSVDLIEEVQEAIIAAEGTVIVVTHDRRMVDALEARHLRVDDGEVRELPRGRKPVEFA